MDFNASIQVPISVNNHTTLAVALSRRKQILFITIDTQRGAGEHNPNIDGLMQASSTSGLELFVTEIWFGDIRTMTADDIERTYLPFLLFFSGSYTEWFMYGNLPDWKDMLDRLSTVMLETDIPSYAVCGSHEFLHKTFANSWAAVGHMVTHGSPNIPVSKELSTDPPTILIPNPRIGEEGTFFNIPTEAGYTDPLNAGIVNRSNSPPHFTEAHSDEVLTGFYSPDFVSLMLPNTDFAKYSPIVLQAINPTDLCQVKLLRYVGPLRRVLYSSQFHPELVVHPDFSGNQRDEALKLGTDGQTLIINFYSLAEQFWMSLIAVSQ
jgi:hypothetical protein